MPSQILERCTPFYGNPLIVHLQAMTQLKIYTLLILTLSLTLASYGQIKKSEQQFIIYYQQLKSSKVDTVLIIKSGCIGCDVTYIDTSKSIIDGQTIYVLTQKNGQFKVAIFDDIHNPKYFTRDTCSLFKFINENKVTLGQKGKFYKTEIPKIKSKSGFYPPSPIHYSYEELGIKLPNFNYDFMIVDDNKDHFGLQRDKEKWFTLTNQIIKRVYNYSQLISN
jgi:hypothetical protein